MKTITLVNRKGGVGKTTSAAYIAMCFHEAGKPVTGLDLDPEASLIKWHQTGSLPYPVVKGDLINLSSQIAELDSAVIIDTPPNDELVIRQTAEVADEVMIPLAPTAQDANRLAGTLSIVAEVEKERQQPLASVLVVRWIERRLLSQEFLEALEQEQVPLLDSKIRNLSSYQSFAMPTYLDEYQAVLKELELL